MIGAYVDKNFVFQVACVRGFEKTLLTTNNFNEMSNLKSGEDVIRYVKDKGIGDANDTDMASILVSERKKLTNDLNELVPDTDLSLVLKVRNDYHNLKAAIKESLQDGEVKNIYLTDCSIDIEDIKKAVKNKDYMLLPFEMAEVLRNSMDVYLKTQDSQLLDVIIDKASLEKMKEVSLESPYDFVKDYAETFVAIADIKISLRAAETKKNKEFLKYAIASCDSLLDSRLIETSSESVESLCSYLSSTAYKEVVPKIHESSHAFEKWCDDKIMDMISDMKYESFGIGPILAYAIAKDQELKLINIIYTSINNGFPVETIKERMRETYV